MIGRRLVIAVRGKPVGLEINVIFAVGKADCDPAFVKARRPDAQILGDFGDADHPLPVLRRASGRVWRIVAKPDGMEPQIAVIGIRADKNVTLLGNGYGCDHDVPHSKPA